MTEKEFLTTEFVYPRNSLFAGMNNKNVEMNPELANRADPLDTKLKKAVLKRLSSETKDIMMMVPERYIFIYDEYIDNGAWNYYKEFESYTPSNFVFELYFCENNTVFYVGRDYKENWEFNPKNYGDDVRLICDLKEYGVRIVAKGLTLFNSEVYADCIRTKYINDGLYIVSRQMERADDESFELKIQGYRNYKDNGIPFIEKEGYLRAFFPQMYYQNDQFDEVTEEDLTVVTVLIFPFDIKYKNMLTEKGIKILKSVGKTTKGIIINGFIKYAAYYFYHKEGKKVFLLEDVIRFLTK